MKYRHDLIIMDNNFMSKKWDVHSKERETEDKDK